MSIISNLPPNYCPEFRAELLKKFYSFTVVDRSPFFPWKNLSDDEINIYFEKDFRCLALYYEVLYQTMP
jgi:hypothetical protein